MNESMSFMVLDENGREIKCEALFTFESEESGIYFVRSLAEGRYLFVGRTLLWAIYKDLIEMQS